MPVSGGIAQIDNPDPRPNHGCVSARQARFDAVVIGAGVAGLWTAARLRASGRSVLLLEARACGAGQTIASQGIIHGGVKYALGGAASRAAAAIARMPDVWRACLRDEPGRDLDLRAVRTLSEHQWIWSAGGVGSRLAGIAASKVIRANVERADDADRPAALRDAPRAADVRRVPEPALDPESIVCALLHHAGGALLADGGPVELRAHADGDAAAIVRNARGDTLDVRCGACVLCAGAGNEALLTSAGATLRTDPPRMQRRPLHMLMARGELPDLWAHCVELSPTPRLTITSRREPDGRTVWYIGGGVAERGVERDDRAQIEAGRAELGATLPWIDTSDLEWSSLRIDRAEGRTPGGARPDEPVIERLGPFVVCWPTKLAFAPLCAAKIHDMIDGVPARASEGDSLDDWPRAGVAPLPWREEGRAWT